MGGPVTTTAVQGDHLAILDVGHGNCAVVILTNWVVVIDAGPKIWLQKFLESRDLSVVNEVFLSHPDRDHLAGLVQLLASRKVTISRVWVDENVDKDTELWDDLLHELKDAQTAGSLIYEGGLDSGEWWAMPQSRHRDSDAPPKSEILGLLPA
jgi:beta-lactamase superfamily II metal-dependent hydrolase